MLKDQMKNLREKARLTKKQIAEAIGITERAYITYEYGQRDVSTETLSKLADFYGVTTDYLLGREPAPDPLGDYNLTDATEGKVIEAFLALPPQIRACILDTIAQLGGIVENSRAVPDANTDEYEEITLGEIEDARNAEKEAYKKDVG